MSHSSEEASPPAADATMDDVETTKTLAKSENSGVDAAKRGLLEKDDQEPPEKKTKTDSKPWRSEEIQSYWQSVEDDPSDFTSWTHILQFVSAKGSLEEGREAFDTFLARFPYCYGYWKKFADFEKKLGSEDTCLAVFERGFQAIPLSVDLWVHYVNYVRSESTNKNIAFVRDQYERAVDACGREWKSDKLWDHYLKWELSLQEESESTVKNYTSVMHLYDRIMKNPTQGLTHHFDKFKQFVVDHNFQEILDTMTFLELRKKVLTEIHTSDIPRTGDSVKGADDGETSGDSAKRPKIDDEICLMRDEIIIAREKVFKETEALVKERSKFEDNIKRPYFHIKPLEKSQLENWNSYLDFEEKQGNPERIEILYERCMISCALYEEFWIKYINWMKSRERELTDESEKSDVVAKIRDIFARASLHLREKIRLHLEQSAFEESHGNFQEAIAILERSTYNYPQLMSLKLKRINAERRQGNTSTVHSLYKGCIDEAESVKVRSEWCLKYARFLKYFCGDDLKGINLLAEAVAIDEDNAKLRLLYVDSLLQLRPFDKSKIVEALDCAINEHKFDCSQRHLFAKRKVAFLEEFGDDVNQVLAAEELCETISVEIENAGYHHHEGGEHGDTDASATSKQSNGTGYDATNSASYSAQHASSYQQYGARYGYPGYSNYPGNYYGGGYQGYGQY